MSELETRAKSKGVDTDELWKGSSQVAAADRLVDWTYLRTAKVLDPAQKQWLHGYCSAKEAEIFSLHAQIVGASTAPIPKKDF
jgi:hypothetical protein